MVVYAGTRQWFKPSEKVSLHPFFFSSTQKRRQMDYTPEDTKSLLKTKNKSDSKERTLFSVMLQQKSSSEKWEHDMSLKASHSENSSGALMNVKPKAPHLLLLLHHVRTVVFAAHHSELDPGQVLCPPSLHQHHVMLLQVVSLTRNEHHRLLSVGQPHPGAFPVSRVGLLGLADHGLQDHGFELGTTKCGAQGLRPRLGLSLPVHLVERCHGSAEEGAGPG